jgi:hypothetical protein
VSEISLRHSPHLQFDNRVVVCYTFLNTHTGEEMTHFTTKESFDSTRSPEWLKVSSEITGMVNAWSGRGDLIASAGPFMSPQAPACFNPNSAEVEVNTSAVFGAGATPSMVDGISDRSMQFEFPEGTGAIYHEALHARYSRWSIPDANKALKPQEFDAIMTLEESRIEARGVSDNPKNKVFLRASALSLVVSDMTSTAESLSSVSQAGRLAGLLMSRVDAGVLDADDIIAVAPVIERILGEEVITKLRGVWSEFQSHTYDANALPLYDLAREWVRILNEKAKEVGEETPEERQQAFAEMMSALAEDAEATAIQAMGEASDQQQSEEWAEIASSSAKSAQEQREHRAEADKVFRKKEVKEDGEAETSRSRSRLSESRPPSSKERASAVKVAQLLEKAKYRERSETVIKSIIPPGRLRTRALVQNSALKAKGVNQQVEAWRRTARKHTEDPTLTIGVMVDISGSMSMAMQPMAVTAWVLSEAGRRVQANSAMVYYGSDVFPTLKKGQHLTEVKVFTAPDNTEKFDRAFKALNGELSLLNGSGARLLVIASDGQYVEPEREKARQWVKSCTDNGVAVVWLEYDGYQNHVKQLLRNDKVEIVSVSKDVTASAEVIGKASARALERITAGI